MYLFFAETKILILWNEILSLNSKLESEHSGDFYFFFMQFLAKIMPKNMLVSSGVDDRFWEILDPLLEQCKNYQEDGASVGQLHLVSQ